MNVIDLNSVLLDVIECNWIECVCMFKNGKRRMEKNTIKQLSLSVAWWNKLNVTEFNWM